MKRSLSGNAASHMVRASMPSSATLSSLLHSLPRGFNNVHIVQNGCVEALLGHRATRPGCQCLFQIASWLVPANAQPFLTQLSVLRVQKQIRVPFRA